MSPKEKEPNESSNGEDDVLSTPQGEPVASLPKTEKITTEEIRKELELFKEKIESTKSFEELIDLLHKEGHIDAVSYIEKIRSDLALKGPKGLYDLIESRKDLGRDIEKPIAEIENSNKDLFKKLNLFYDKELNKALKNKVIDFLKEQAEIMLKNEETEYEKSP